MTLECIICATVLKHRLILVSIQKDVEKWRELGEERFHECTCLNNICYGGRLNKLSSLLVTKLKVDLDFSASMMGQRFQFLAIV